MLSPRFVCTTLMVVSAAVSASPHPGPPSGRPPVGPLQRYDPKLYDATFGVTMMPALQQYANEDGAYATRANYDLRDAPIVMPLIYQGTFSRLKPDSVTGELWLDNRSTNPNLEIKEGFPFNTSLAVMTIGRFQGQAVRWKLGYRVQAWSARIDDNAAGHIGWPQEWPKEVQDGLKAQMYIESDDPVFKQTVDRVSEGKLRLVPPYLAAKDLIRYAINNVQVSGDGIDQGAMGQLRGIEVFGAKQAATDGIGTPHDLVCVCVAMLRAAGIPARPVIGIQEREKDGKNEFVSWGEFYLPECGWIPFDPFVMRGKGIRTLDVRKPWPELGNMKDLNRRIPLAYHFMPAATVETPQNPSLWGWDPRPGGGANSEQAIDLGIVSRGKGEDDPQ
jgi:hypothetical protein